LPAAAGSKVVASPAEARRALDCWLTFDSSVVLSARDFTRAFAAVCDAGRAVLQFKWRLVKLGAQAVSKTRATPVVHLKAEIVKWGPIIKKAGIYAD